MYGVRWIVQFQSHRDQYFISTAAILNYHCARGPAALLKKEVSDLTRLFSMITLPVRGRTHPTGPPLARNGPYRILQSVQETFPPLRRHLLLVSRYRARYYRATIAEKKEGWIHHGRVLGARVKPRATRRIPRQKRECSR